MVISSSPEKWQQLLSLTLAGFTNENGSLAVNGDDALTLESFLETINATIPFNIQWKSED